MTGNIRYIDQRDLDRKKYEACLDRCAADLPYARSWYLDVVSPRWDALVLEDYEAVMPLPRRKKYGVDYIFQPPFVQQLGVFGSRPASMAHVENFLQAIPSFYKWVDCNLNAYNTGVPENWLQRWNNNLCLSVHTTIGHLRSHYSQNLKRNLKKAREARLQFERGEDVEVLIRLFRNGRGHGISAMTGQTYDILRSLVQTPAQRGSFRIRVARNANREVVAGALFLQEGERSIFLFSGLSPEGKACGAMAALIDHWIEEQAGGVLKILDFEGSNDAGLARFYNAFGAYENRYATIGANRLPLLLRLLKIPR